MSVAEDTTQIPTPIPEVVAVVDAPAAAIVNDINSHLSIPHILIRSPYEQK